MPLQGVNLGWPAIALLLGSASILAVFYIKRRAKGFRSQNVRRTLDAIWVLSIFALAMWLVLAN
jgi:hypothetical protein